MLARLADERLVALHHRGAARLAPAGERLALRVVRRHRLLETLLVRVLGLDWAEAHVDAEELERHVSDRVLGALDAHLGHPYEDPHGHAIPDAHGRLRRRALVRLVELPAGDSAIVREIRDRDPLRMRRWLRAGLVPGARVRMRTAVPEDDVHQLEVEGRPLVVDHDALKGVRIERRRREARP